MTVARPSPDPRLALRVLVTVATIVALIGGAVLVLLSPPVMHIGLDYAGSARILGLSVEGTHRVSDQAVQELLVGPGTFAFPVVPDGPPFFGATEASHLRDVRVISLGILALWAVAVAVLAVGLLRARRSGWLWSAVRAGAATVLAAFVTIGVVLLVAFDPAFTLFHLVFFPGGNWAFDPVNQRIVQLHPTTFWQYAAAMLAGLSTAGGLAALWLARRYLRRARSSPKSTDRSGHLARPVSSD